VHGQRNRMITSRNHRSIIGAVESGMLCRLKDTQKSSSRENSLLGAASLSEVVLSPSPVLAACSMAWCQSSRQPCDNPIQKLVLPWSEIMSMKSNGFGTL
jgi:hypothetical protein